MGKKKKNMDMFLSARGSVVLCTHRNNGGAAAAVASAVIGRPEHNVTHSVMSVGDRNAKKKKKK